MKTSYEPHLENLLREAYAKNLPPEPGTLELYVTNLRRKTVHTKICNLILSTGDIDLNSPDIAATLLQTPITIQENGHITLQAIGLPLEIAILSPTILRHITEIDFSNSIEKISNLDIENLAQNNHLTKLSSINFESSKLSRRALASLCSHPKFSKLKNLNLRNTPLTDEHLQILSRQNQNFQNLTTLNLSGTTLSNTGLNLLSNGQIFPNLQSLDLSNNPLNEDGLRFLTNSKNFPNLTILKLANINLSNNQTFQTSIGGPIDNFTITHENIGTTVLADIIDNPDLQNLTDLHLEYTKIGDTSLKHLVRSPNFSKLKKLNLSHCLLSTQGIAILTKTKTLLQKIKSYLQSNNPSQAYQLIHLDLSGNEIKNAGLKYLANCPHFPSLTHLNISDCSIEDDGFAALAKNSHFPNLQNIQALNNLHSGGTNAFDRDPAK